MKKLLKSIWNACYFLLCFAQVPILAGHFLLGDSMPAILILAAILPVSFVISLLPGRIGGKKKNDEPVVVRKSMGGDPDPDRALRNEALPLPEKKAFPLRGTVCLIVALAIAVAIFLLPAFSEVWWVRRFLLALIMAIMLPLALRMAAANQNGSGSVLAGMLAYAASGIFAYVEKEAVLDQRLMLCGFLFVVMTAFSMNNQSMHRSTVFREGIKPPLSMRRRNRILLSVILVVGLIVLYFDKIREKTIDFLQWILKMIGAFLSWLNSLIPRPESSGGGPGGGMGDIMTALGGGETGAFWVVTEKIIIVLAALVGLVGLFFLIRKIGRGLVKLYRKILANLKKFTDSVSEDYQDELENLFDWDETRKEMGENLKKRISKLLYREKKWEQMDGRERVRFVVRSLYRKVPDGGSLKSLTVHEALGRIRTGQAKPEELAAVYDTVRYGQAEPDIETVERLRKEAKV